MPVANVTAGGPPPADTAGGVLWAPLGTVLPTDAKTPFDVAWKKLGLVGNDGVTPGGERSIEDILDWNGDVIANLQTSHSSTFTFPLVEVYSEDVQKLVFGDANVTVTPADTVTGTGKLISVKETGSELEHACFGFQMHYLGKAIRLVVADGKPTTIEEAGYTKGGLQMFTVTVSNYKDTNGVKVYRYYEDQVQAA